MADLPTSPDSGSVCDDCTSATSGTCARHAVFVGPDATMTQTSATINLMVTCPECGTLVDGPLDGFGRICEECGLVWDSATGKRSKDRLPWARRVKEAVND